MVPYGQSTDADADATCGPNFICYTCMCVNVFMAYAFEEVVDMATDGLMSPEFYFKQQESKIGCAVTVIRVLGTIFCILGLYLLFSPVIQILSFVPLVGALLSSVLAYAALIFAVLVGLTLSLAALGLAWLFYRPAIGLTLLALVFVSVYVTFNYQ